MQMNTTTRTSTQQPKPIIQPQVQQQQQTLIIRLQERPNTRVSWTQNTIDNEFMNKKKSNLCCIYHRPGETSSDTCTSDDEGNALERDRHTKHQHKKVCSKKGNGGKKDKEKKDTCPKGPHQHEKKFMDQ